MNSENAILNYSSSPLSSYKHKLINYFLDEVFIYLLIRRYFEVYDLTMLNSKMFRGTFPADIIVKEIQSNSKHWYQGHVSCSFIWLLYGLACHTASDIKIFLLLGMLAILVNNREYKKAVLRNTKKGNTKASAMPISIHLFSSISSSIKLEPSLRLEPSLKLEPPPLKLEPSLKLDLSG